MGFLDRLNDVGVAAPFDSGMGTDASDVYGNLNKLSIEFYHLPSDKSVSFKAYLTSWDDKFSSNYNSEEVFGRNDPIHTFQGTFREISLSWDVVAGSIQEAQENLARVSMLAQFLYPAYKRETFNISTSNSAPQNLMVGTMTKAPLVKVRFANLIVDSKGQLDDVSAKETGLLCAMDGLQVTADLEAGVIDGLGLATPKVFKLTCGLKVLHQHTLGWDNARKEWLGEGNSEGYPYNAWGGGKSTSNSLTIGGGSSSGPSAGRTGSPPDAGAAREAAPPPDPASPPPLSDDEIDDLTGSETAPENTVEGTTHEWEQQGGGLGPEAQEAARQLRELNRS